MAEPKGGAASNVPEEFYRDDIRWRDQPAEALVVACSDARFAEAQDRFLRHELDLTCWDRLSVPGGAGALASSGSEFTRAHRIRTEAGFLIQVHRLERIVLLFHGPGADGPAAALCGDYRRKFPHYSATQIRDRQEQDAREVIGTGFGAGVVLELYRCEVDSELRISFVPLLP